MFLFKVLKISLKYRHIVYETKIWKIFETFKVSRYLSLRNLLSKTKEIREFSFASKIPTIPNFKFQIEFYFQSEQIKASESQRMLKALRVQSN